MKKSLENISNILDVRVTTTGKSTEGEPRLNKNVVIALSSRFSRLRRDVIEPLALTMRDVGEDESGEESDEGEDGKRGESEGEESEGEEEESEDEQADEEAEGEEETVDEEAREQAKVPKKRPGVDMPSAARERVLRKR